MVKPSGIPRYRDYFSAAEGAFTGWLAGHPRSLLTGARNPSGIAIDAKQDGLVLAGGDEVGRPGKNQKTPNARCEFLNDSLRVARAEASQAKVMHDNRELEVRSRARELDRLNAQLNAIFRRLEQVDRELAERQSDLAPDPVTDARKPPQKPGGWFREVLRTTATPLLLTMLRDFLLRMDAEGKKSAHADRTRELIEERHVVQEDWAGAEGRRREEQAKYEAATKRIKVIEQQMVMHGCPIPPGVHV